MSENGDSLNRQEEETWSKVREDDEEPSHALRVPLSPPLSAPNLNSYPNIASSSDSPQRHCITAGEGIGEVLELWRQGNPMKYLQDIKSNLKLNDKQWKELPDTVQQKLIEDYKFMGELKILTQKIDSKIPINKYSKKDKKPSSRSTLGWTVGGTIIFVLIILIIARILWPNIDKENKSLSINIDYDVGSMITGVLGGSGALIAALTYAYKNRENREASNEEEASAEE